MIRGLEALYQYAAEVKSSTEELLGKLPYRDLKKKFGEADKERLRLRLLQAFIKVQNLTGS